MRARLLLFLLMVLVAMQGLAQDALPESVDLSQIEADFVGKIDANTPFYDIPFNVRRTGSTIQLDLAAVSGDLDTLMYLVDARGNIVAENDDRVRGDTNSLIVFPQAAAGQYRVIATRYGVKKGKTSGQFRLLIDVEEYEAARYTYSVTPGALLDAGYPALEPRPEAQWTVLAYYGGDTNLEAGILNDLKEFEVGGGSDDRVRIVALMDRHPDFTPASGDWRTTKIFEIGPDTSGDLDGPTIDTQELADLGDIDTGSGETLAQFLVWGIRTFPARNYVIALASHGAGWQGIITDETAALALDIPDYTILSVPELQAAFETARQETTLDRFAFLINDACLMSSIEYYGGISEFFEYSVASPEIVVNPALDMTLFTELLRNNASYANFETIGRTLVDKYIDEDVAARKASDAVYLTNAVTRLRRFDVVTQAVEAFAGVVNANPVARSLEVGAARANAYTYTAFLGGVEKVDLGNLMQRLIARSNDDELIAAAQNVVAALELVRVYGRAGARVQDATSYYNIYFPQDSAKFRMEYFDQTPLKEWSRMLRNYYNAVTPNPWVGAGVELAFHPPAAPNVKITQIYPTDTPVSIVNPALAQIEVVGRNISHGDVTIDQIQPDGSALRLSTERFLTDVEVGGRLERLNQWNTGLTQVNINWDSTLPVVTDGEISHNELIVFTEEVGFLEGRYREPGREIWNDVGIALDVEDGTVQRIINRSEATGAVAVIEIAPGSEFQVYRRIVTPDGIVQSVPGNVYMWPVGGVTWSWQPAPSGEYRMGMLVTAFGGTSGFVDTTIVVDDDGLDAGLRAETRLDLGFTLERPEPWNRLLFFSGDVFYRTASPDQGENRSVYFARSADVTPQDIVASVLELYGFEAMSEIAPLEIAGKEAAVFDYRYERDGQTVLGRGIATYTNFGIVFSAEAVEGEGDLEANYAGLLAGLRFFDPASVGSSAEWMVIPFPEEMRYPAPLAWAANAGLEGEWVRFAPVPPAAEGEEKTAAHYTFFAVGRFPVQVQTLTNIGALNNVMTGVVTASAQKVLITGTNTLYGEEYRWEATTYEAVRDGVEIIGRVYVTNANQRAYTVWVEAARDEDAARIFEEIFETVVDGLRIAPADLDAVAEASS